MGSCLRVVTTRKDELKLVITQTCSVICSVDNEKQYWIWDAGEKLLWDNNIEIKL